MAGVSENATQQAGHPLNLFDLEPAVPDANTLLSLKLLKEADPDAFAGLAQESVRWLALGLSLVRSDPFLRVKFGGDNINAAMQLAPILKRRVEEKHVQARLDQMADGALETAFDSDLGNMPASMKPIGVGDLEPIGDNLIGKHGTSKKLQLKMRQSKGLAITT